MSATGLDPAQLASSTMHIMPFLWRLLTWSTHLVWIGNLFHPLNGTSFGPG